MADERSSVHHLPAGKLQDLKNLFETRDAESSGTALLFGMSPKSNQSVSDVTQPRHASTFIPQSDKLNSNAKPAKDKFESGRKFSLDVDKQEHADSVDKHKSQKSNVAEKQEWLTTLERKIASKRLSPTASRHAFKFTDNVSNKEDDKGLVSKQINPTGANIRSGMPRQKPGQSLEQITKLKTVLHQTSTTTSQNPIIDESESEVKVIDRLKAFENRISYQSSDKPNIPKKPAGLTQNVNTTRDKSCSSSSQNEFYDPPWDTAPGKNLSHLKAVAVDTPSEIGPAVITTRKSNKPSLPSSAAPVQTSTAVSSSKTQQPKSNLRPTEEPPPPPPFKPPRTFTHDQYLKTKLTSIPEPLRDGVSNNENLLGSKSKNPHHAGIKEHVSIMPSKVAVDSALQGDKSRYSHLNQNRVEIESKGIREPPPARPPPPCPRPSSDVISPVPSIRNPPEVQDEDSETYGPVVISLKFGRLNRHASMAGPHRHPDDQLPEIPDEDIKRFPLRKSYSSECLNKGSLSSIAELSGDDRSPQSSLFRSYHAQDEPIYGAVVDSEGYAVPHQFIRINAGGQGDMNATNRPLDKTSPFWNLKRVLVRASPTADPSPKPTPIKDQDIDKVPRKKMNLVRQKINQAYEILHITFKKTSTSESEAEASEQVAQDKSSTDSDSVVDDAEIKKRITYCSTVRLKTHQVVKKSQEYLDAIYPQLFECTLIVGLQPKTNNPGYEAYVIHKFPERANSNVSVPKFCFPDAAEIRPGFTTLASESYSFVLTNVDGGKLFGYCRRMQPRDASLPEVICIISPVDAFNMYNKLLSEIETRRLKSLDLAKEMIAASYGRPLPKPGKVCQIRSLDDNAQMETIFLDRCEDNHLANVNYEALLVYLGTEKLIKVFGTMLLERRLILCSRQLSVLTQTIHALVALLYPFHWQHGYIPILPPDMIDVCAAPTPFIIGVLHSHIQQVTTLELEEVIIVDLDKKQVLKCVGDESTILPKKLARALKTALNMCKVDSDAQSTQWLMVSEAFLRMFIETIGHFGQYITTQQDGTKSLLKDQFIAGSASRSIRHFLEWFTETQMFEVFITMHLEHQNWGSMDLFMSRLSEHQSMQAEVPRYRGLGQKVKNIGKVIKTKLVMN